jgi:hypothetical protein
LSFFALQHSQIRKPFFSSLSRRPKSFALLLGATGDRTFGVRRWLYEALGESFLKVVPGSLPYRILHRSGFVGTPEIVSAVN